MSNIQPELTFKYQILTPSVLLCGVPIGVINSIQTGQWIGMFFTVVPGAATMALVLTLANGIPMSRRFQKFFIPAFTFLGSSFVGAFLVALNRETIPESLHVIVPFAIGGFGLIYWISWLGLNFMIAKVQASKTTKLNQ